MFSATSVMADGQVEEDPPHGLHARRTWILTSLVYATPVDNEESLHRRIVDACQTICNYLGIFEQMRRFMMRCVEECIESHGGHFEHLLYVYSFSYNSKMKCFRAHVDMNMVSCFGMRNSCPKFVRNFQLRHLFILSFTCFLPGETNKFKFGLYVQHMNRDYNYLVRLKIEFHPQRLMWHSKTKFNQNSPNSFRYYAFISCAVCKTRKIKAQIYLLLI
jgi:hypothetical protein